MVIFNNNTEEKIITAKFTGRMDTIAALKLNEMIQDNLQIKDGKTDMKIIFDLGEVDYIASSFIRICVSTAKQAGAGMFSIVNCQPFIKKTFKISGLDSILNVS